MTEIPVRYSIFLSGDGAKASGVELIRWDTVPYQLRAGDVVGLEPLSDFDCDTSKVVECIWHAGKKAIYAKLESAHSSDFAKSLTYLIKECGFSAHLRFDFSTAEKADGVDPGNYTVIESGGKFYAETADGLAALDIQGADYRIVMSPAEQGERVESHG